MIDRRYPVGTFAEVVAQDTDYYADVAEIASFAERLGLLLEGLSPKQFTQHYREGSSWTIPTLVHHCADSHMHAYLRTKKALTEPGSEMPPYDETLTAELPDYAQPLEDSLLLLQGLHRRFAGLLGELSAEQRELEYFHLGQERAITVREVARTYAWHGRHHYAHIELAAFDPA